MQLGILETDSENVSLDWAVVSRFLLMRLSWIVLLDVVEVEELKYCIRIRIRSAKLPYRKPFLVSHYYSLLLHSNLHSASHIFCAEYSSFPASVSHLQEILRTFIYNLSPFEQPPMTKIKSFVFATVFLPFFRPYISQWIRKELPCMRESCSNSFEKIQTTDGAP